MTQLKLEIQVVNLENLKNPNPMVRLQGHGPEGKNPTFMLRILMQAMVNRHLIPTRKWLIKVFW